MYNIAANWIKVKAVDRPGQATMFVTSKVDTPVTKKPGSTPKGSSESKKPEFKSKSEKESKLAKVECFTCQQKGHYSNKCPMKKASVATTTGDEDDEDPAFHVNATWDMCVFNTRQVSVNSAVDPKVKVQPDWVLLDNQADISILHPRFLTDIETCAPVRVNGIGGLTMVIDKTGYLKDPEIRVHSSEKAIANVLSFAEVEDKYEVTYLPQEGFVVHLKDRELFFQRTGKL